MTKRQKWDNRGGLKENKQQKDRSVHSRYIGSRIEGEISNPVHQGDRCGVLHCALGIPRDGEKFKKIHSTCLDPATISLL